MNRGGQANEAGSAHRAAVAAYLAVHGIAGRPLHAMGPDAPTVVSLAFETEDPADDIRCELSDGKVLMLQAKRVCGVDEHLRATLAQWVRQPLVEPAADGGQRQVLVGVVAERFKGRVAELRAALNRRRPAVRGVPSAPERDAVAAVTKELAETTDASGEVLADDRRESLLDAAFALLIDAREPSAPQRGEAGAWLEAVGATSGHGDAAFDVLQHFFQGQASTASGSRLDDWLTALAKAGHPVADDPRGLVGQRRMAERRALQEYRDRLAADRDVLHLSALAGPLPEMRVPGLLASFRVDVGKADENPRRRSFGLAEVARRWGRLVVTGLPGAGKSCALDQLAAVWAEDDDAPIPLLVRLRDVAGRIDRGPDLTLDRLVESAITTSPQSDHELLRPVLATALREGDAALLLDGLDECGARAGAVAAGIAALAKELPLATGIVVSTRHSKLLEPVAITRQSGSSEYKDFKLPIVDLETPSSLEKTLHHLVQHAAQAYGHVKDSAWVQQRQAQVERASLSDRGLWSVPLLATLMTLQIVRRGPSTADTSRARLIAEAVEKSAARWRDQEHALPPDLRPHVRPKMVVEGFAIIAHALAGGSVVRRSAVVTAIGDHLGGFRWSKAPGDAEALAEAVVDFWDRHVGAFLVGDGDVIEPRAVHLVEIGAALWVRSQDAQERDRWFAVAIHHENRREAVVLAAGLSAEALGSLVETAASTPDAAARRRGLDWAAEAAADHRGGADDQGSGAVAARTHERLIDALGAEASAERNALPARQGSSITPSQLARDDRDGPGWRWVRHLASLPLPAGLRPRRDERLERQPLTDEQRVVADALRLLTDAVVDGSTALPVETVRAGEALLGLDVPDEPDRPVERKSRRFPDILSQGPSLLSGHVDAAVLLLRYPEVLDEDAVQVVHRLARFASFRTWGVITALLKAASLPAPLLWSESQKDLFRSLSGDESLSADEPYRWFFDAAAEYGSSAEPDRPSRWSLTELATTADLLHLSTASIPELRHAKEADPADAALVIGALADAHGVDRGRLSGQARYVRDAGKVQRRFLHGVMLAPGLPSTAQPQPAAAVPSDVVDDLLDLFGHPSALLADAVRDLLYATDDPAVGERLRARAPDMPAGRRWWAALVATLLAEDPADTAQDLLTSPDGPTRAGAARAAALVADDGDTDAADVVARSREDPDLMVRHDAGASLHAGQAPRLDLLVRRGAEQVLTCPQVLTHHRLPVLELLLPARLPVTVHAEEEQGGHRAGEDLTEEVGLEDLVDAVRRRVRQDPDDRARPPRRGDQRPDHRFEHVAVPGGVLGHDQDVEAHPATSAPSGSPSSRKAAASSNQPAAMSEAGSSRSRTARSCETSRTSTTWEPSPRNTRQGLAVCERYAWSSSWGECDVATTCVRPSRTLRPISSRSRWTRLGWMPFSISSTKTNRGRSGLSRAATIARNRTVPSEAEVSGVRLPSASTSWARTRPLRSSAKSSDSASMGVRARTHEVSCSRRAPSLQIPCSTEDRFSPRSPSVVMPTGLASRAAWGLRSRKTMDLRGPRATEARPDAAA